MIDIEFEVVDLLSEHLESEFPDILITSEDLRAPSVFPAVSIVEADNYTTVSTSDSKTNENHVDVMYEINVYSNKSNGKKSEAKKILKSIDKVLEAKGFYRIYTSPLNMENATIYRLVSRYRARVSLDHTIYRS